VVVLSAKKVITFCTVMTPSDEQNHGGDFNIPDAAEKQATIMPVSNSSTESRNY